MYSIDDDHDEEQGVLGMPCIRCMGGGDTPMGDKWAGLGAGGGMGHPRTRDAVQEANNLGDGHSREYFLFGKSMTSGRRPVVVEQPRRTSTVD